jgi:hypothetical protein
LRHRYACLESCTPRPACSSTDATPHRPHLQLEARAAAASKAQLSREQAAAKTSAAAAKARISELEEALTSLALRSERQMRDALAAAAQQSAATLAAAVSESQTAAAAAEARARALEDSLVGSEQLALRLTATLQSKAAADNEAALLVASLDSLSVEAAALRVARAAAEARATDGEARGAAADLTVAERVKATLAAADACIGAAETVRLETEQRAAAAAVCAAQALQAAVARADAAEAELARRVLMLDVFAQATADKEAALGQLSAAKQRILALDAECEALRTARMLSDEAASMARARAETAQASLDAETARRAKALEEKWHTAESLLEARVAHMPLEMTLAKAEAVGAAAAAAAAEERLAEAAVSAARERSSLERALRVAEQAAADWKARALAWEAAASGAGDGAGAQAPHTGRLRATLRGTELRRLLVHGTFTPPEQHAEPDADAAPYVFPLEDAAPEASRAPAVDTTEPSV